MDYSALPHFCRKEGSRSSRRGGNTYEDCYSLDHPFHQQLYNYMKTRSGNSEPTRPLKQGSVHVEMPLAGPKKAEFCKALESEWKRLQNQDWLQDIKIHD